MRRMQLLRGRYAVLTALTVIASALVAPAHASEPPPDLALFRSIYKELVEINTTDSTGDTLRAAEAMARRLRDGGLPASDIQVLSSGPRKGNLVARLRGTGERRPLLLMAHIDVVEANPADWLSDPFTLRQIDGTFRARGVADDKAMAASFVTNLIRYVKAGFRPQRDIIVALTADEELSDSPHNGASWLLKNHRDLIDAEIAINEGGSGALRDGKPFRNSVQLAEKVYQSYRLEVKDPGGHSASGRRDNAIYRVAEALVRLGHYDFPARLVPVTRVYLSRIRDSEDRDVGRAIDALLAGRNEPDEIAPLTTRPNYNAIIRTTCVATMLNAGEVENALPQNVRATVNCRILPDEAVGDVTTTLTRVIDDPKITVTPVGTAVLSPPSPLNPEMMQAVEDITAAMWPGVPVIPTMSGGYTDSRWLRNAGIATYGVSGLFSEPGRSGVHGVNEQVGISELDYSREFLDRLVRRLAGPQPSPR